MATFFKIFLFRDRMRDTGGPLNLVVARKAGIEVETFDKQPLTENSCSNQPKPTAVHLSGICSVFNHQMPDLRIIFCRQALTGSLVGRRCEQRSRADKSLSSRECLKRRNTSTPAKEAILAGKRPPSFSLVYPLSTLSLSFSGFLLLSPSLLSFLYFCLSFPCSSFLLAYHFPQAPGGV